MQGSAVYFGQAPRRGLTSECGTLRREVARNWSWVLQRIDGDTPRSSGSSRPSGSTLRARWTVCDVVRGSRCALEASGTRGVRHWMGACQLAGILDIASSSKKARPVVIPPSIEDTGQPFVRAIFSLCDRSGNSEVKPLSKYLKARASLRRRT